MTARATTPEHRPAQIFSRDKHLGHLDSLRGIAILGVMLVHSAILSGQTGVGMLIGFTGQRGVQLFYMISAFTISLSLDGERREHYPLSNYFLRRFFRIAPLFYIVIVCNLLLKLVAPEYSSLRQLGYWDVTSGFLFLNGVRPKTINSVVAGGWSIAVETTFYLLLPLLHRTFNTIRRTFFLFVFSAPVLLTLSRIFASAAHNSSQQQFFAFLWFPVEFPVFVLGLLTYRIWQSYIMYRAKKSHEHKDLSLVLLLGAFILYGACLPFSDGKLYFSSFIFLPLILGLSLYPWPCLVNRLTIFIGKISYSLYLLHFFAIEFVSFILKPFEASHSRLMSQHMLHGPLGLVAIFSLVFALSVPLCTLSWKYLEQPGIRLGRRLIAKREGRHLSRANQSLIPRLGTLEQPGSTSDAQF